MAGDALWSLEALTSLCTHPDVRVRTWAVRRLGLSGDPAVLPALSQALGDASEAVVWEAILALAHLELPLQHDPIRPLLLGVAQRKDLSRKATLGALRRLVRDGDAEATTRFVAECLRDQSLQEWLTLGEFAPARYLKLATERRLLSNNAVTPFGLVALLPRVAPIEALPTLYAKLSRIRDPDDKLIYQEELLRRCRAEHILPAAADPPPLAEILHPRRRSYMGPGTQASVARWLGDDVFADLAAALRRNRWHEAVVWSRQWCARHGGDEECDRWTRALLRAMPSDRTARAVDGLQAACLAIGVSERAIEREVPFAACDLSEQFARTGAGPDALWTERMEHLVARWNHERHDPSVQGALHRALESLLDQPTHVVCNVLAVACQLPGLSLPPALLELSADPESDLPTDRTFCLQAQPDALRTLAPRSLDHDGERAQDDVLDALGAQNARWVADLLRPRFEVLLRSDHAELLLAATAELGDVSLLPEVIAAWAPGELSAAETAYHLALLGDRVASLPAALVHDAESARARTEGMTEKFAGASSLVQGVRSLAAEAEALPLRLSLRCNRCQRQGSFTPKKVIIHPDLEACKRAGWDGVTFERIVVCKFCGAEDDYTLGPDAMLVLLSGSLLKLIGSQGPPSADPVAGGPVHVGIAGVADGTPIRRASDVLRHWQARIAQDPNDAEAWLRLGYALRRSERVAEAWDALQRAATLRPTDLDAPTVLLDMLLEQDRASEGRALAQTVLTTMAEGDASHASRIDAVRVVLEYAQALLAEGRPLALEAEWARSLPREEMAPDHGAIDLRRIGRWDRLHALLASPNVRLARLRDPGPGDADSALERFVEETGLQRTRPVSAPNAPTVRVGPKLGRNDPCHCGSGKKLKKCHGA